MAHLLAALAVLLAGAAAAAVLRRSPLACGTAAALAVTVASLLGLVPAIRALAGAATLDLRLPWAVPNGSIVLGLDPLSAFFLVPLLVLAPPCAWFGRAYLAGGGRTRSLAPAWAAFCLLVASMTLCLVARNGLLFLVAWEVMALAAYLLVTFDHQDAEVRRAGLVYLLATHAGTAALVAFFLLLGRASGSLDFTAASAAGAPGGASFLFLLALAGFGVKAGLVPAHVWLPEAHAAAPSHVSAMMSAVLIKLGLYGILRAVLLLGGPLWWWGAALAVLGLVGALITVTLALQQTDLKRALAYSSVENVGLIATGLGLGLWGSASGNPLVATLGMAGALLHVWNHAVMKGLLFLAAGSVLHGAGSKRLARLGGLLQRMPRTGLAFVAGAVAIAGLPPLNGFSGKWLLYLGFLRAGGADGAPGLAALFAVGVLALVGGLAALCFVRLAGVVVLGAPRSPQAAAAHESSPGMTAPLLLLALACVASGLVPGRLLAAIATPLLQLVGGSREALDLAAVPLARLGAFDAALWLAMAAVALALCAALASRPRSSGETWGCGYVQPGPRMQYTGTSFSQLLSDRIVPTALRPATVQRLPSELFPAPGEFAIATPDPFTRAVYEPFFRRSADRFARLRWVQQGVLHLYLLYIVAALVLALVWGSLAGGGR